MKKQSDLDCLWNSLFSRANNHIICIHNLVDVTPDDYTATIIRPEWTDAALDTFVSVGGVKAFETAVAFQNDIDPNSWNDSNDEFAERMMTASFLRDGGGKAMIAAAKAYIRAANATASRKENRVWKQDRRRASNHLLGTARSLVGLLQYYPFGRTYRNIRYRLYQAPGPYGNWGSRETDAAFDELAVAVGMADKITRLSRRQRKEFAAMVPNKRVMPGVTVPPLEMPAQPCMN